MGNTKTFVFISIDGMTDPLGQSQVLPYLIGLARLGHSVQIISSEKKENWQSQHQIVEAQLAEVNILWKYCFYETGKPFISQFQNFLALKKQAIALIQNYPKHQRSNVILHCRSYLAGLIGLDCKKRFGTGFIFDMRGFWADERLEGGIWNKANLIHSFLYAYFKKKEKTMIRESDAIVSLTHKGKQIIIDWDLGISSSKLTVIPCCADLSYFSKHNIQENRFITFKNKISRYGNQFILSYVGSLGTWYMAEEMLQFFKELTEHTPAHFLIITKDDKQHIYDLAEKIGISTDSLSVVTASRSDMPYYIALSSASLFFIKPSFSKSASSPTKMGELLSMGIPVITNSGVGDVDSVIRASKCGILVSDFNNNNYKEAIFDLMKNRHIYQANTVNAAHRYFSLNTGIERYKQIYDSFN